MKDLAERLYEVEQDETSGKLTREEAIMKRDRLQNEFYNRINGIIDLDPLQYELFPKK